MYSSNLKQIVKSCAEQYGVKSVWLFGSAVTDEQHANDIDLAVEGLDPEKFFAFYGRLFLELPKMVDLVDLSQNPPIASIVRQKGICIYERRS
jgi:predicted nucleotidyltransferase